MVKSSDSEARLPEFTFCLFSLQLPWPWESYLLLFSSFHICKMGIIIVTTSRILRSYYFNVLWKSQARRKHYINVKSNLNSLTCYAFSLKRCPSRESWCFLPNLSMHIWLFRVMGLCGFQGGMVKAASQKKRPFSESGSWVIPCLWGTGK